jgi:hypothetical protein
MLEQIQRNSEENRIQAILINYLRVKTCFSETPGIQEIERYANAYSAGRRLYGALLRIRKAAGVAH